MDNHELFEYIKQTYTEALRNNHIMVQNVCMRVMVGYIKNINIPINHLKWIIEQIMAIDEKRYELIASVPKPEIIEYWCKGIMELCALVDSDIYMDSAIVFNIISKYTISNKGKPNTDHCIPQALIKAFIYLSNRLYHYTHQNNVTTDITTDITTNATTDVTTDVLNMDALILHSQNYINENNIFLDENDNVFKYKKTLVPIDELKI